jgi:hypothetical protein
MPQWQNFIHLKIDLNMTTMNNEVWRSIEKVRWLQTKELAKKYPNDAELGTQIRQLIAKTPETI